MVHCIEGGVRDMTDPYESYRETKEHWRRKGWLWKLRGRPPDHGDDEVLQLINTFPASQSEGKLRESTIRKAC
jgi:hypothetical protein